MRYKANQDALSGTGQISHSQKLLNVFMSVMHSIKVMSCLHNIPNEKGQQDKEFPCFGTEMFKTVTHLRSIKDNSH